MRTVLEGNIRFGNVSSSSGDGYVVIEVEDEKSGIEFLRIEVPYETYGKLVAGSSSHKVNLQVWGLEKLGKVRQSVRASVTIPTATFDEIVHGNWHDREEKIANYIDLNHSIEGWINSRYYGSRDSTVGDYKTKTTTINFHRTRWVEDVNAGN